MSFNIYYCRKPTSKENNFYCICVIIFSSVLVFEYQRGFNKAEDSKMLFVLVQ